MNTNNNTKITNSFWVGILYSMVASFALSVICASYLGFGIFPMWASFAGFITLLGVMVIGIPVVLALKEFNQDTCLNAALSGGFITFLIMLGLSGLSLDWLSYISIFYGFVCGYAFMKGYRQGQGK